jgi:hypothetical protein
VGSAYLFDTTTGQELLKLVPSDGVAGDEFGEDVAVHGSTAAVSSRSDDGPGSVYLFDLASGQQLTKLFPSDGAAGDRFGESVAIGGTAVVIGSVLDDDNGTDSGAAYLCQQVATFCADADGSLAACPCANPGNQGSGCDSPIPAGQGGATTGGIRLDLVAQQTTPQNRATFSGSGFPSGSAPLALVIRGEGLHSATPVVFGDGLKCVASPLVRLAATAASAGTSTHTFGNGSMAGAGWKYYQLWFRSLPASFCDPLAAFNLSNGVSLVW